MLLFVNFQLTHIKGQNHLYIPVMFLKQLADRQSTREVFVVHNILPNTLNIFPISFLDSYKTGFEEAIQEGIISEDFIDNFEIVFRTINPKNYIQLPSNFIEHLQLRTNENIIITGMGDNLKVSSTNGIHAHLSNIEFTNLLMP